MMMHTPLPRRSQCSVASQIRLPLLLSLWAGCSAFVLLHAQTASSAAPAPKRVTVRLTDGQSLTGTTTTPGAAEIQLLGTDKKIHLLRKAGERYRAVTSQTD